MTDREIYDLFIRGMYYTDIAEHLGIHVSQVFSAIERTHQFLVFGVRNV